MMWWYGGWGWWGWAGMVISIVVFWGLVIGGIAVLARYVAPPGAESIDSRAPDETPEWILTNRYARGEIEEEEFEHRLEILRSSAPTSGCAPKESRETELVGN